MEPNDTTTDGTSPEGFRRAIRSLAWAVVGVIALVLTVVAVAVVYTAVTGADRQDDIDQINSALCTFRSDLQTRVDDANRFLVEHPKGLEGISPEAIQQSIDNQQRTLNSLATLNC